MLARLVVVALLLSPGAVAAQDGTTPLHWAAHNNDITLAARLIQEGADVMAANQFGATPWSEAATVGNPQMLALLLKAGANVNAANPNGQTALMLVARTGNVEAARLLVAAGADVNAREGWLGQTALMWAASDNDAAMVRDLLAAGADVDARSTVHEWERDVTAEPRRKYMPRGGWTPLLFAARDGAGDAARVLVEAGADLDLEDPDLVTPIVTAIVNGHYDIARLLAERGADIDRPDRWGRTALWAAIDMHTLPSSGRPDVEESDAVSSAELVQLLLARGANVDASLTLFPPYRSLADRGNDNMITIGATPLLRAAKAGDVDGIRWLLEKGADVSLATIEGITPLLAAAGVGSRDSDTRGRFRTEAQALESVQLLLDAGADVTAATGAGTTALHGAAFWGWNSVVRLLAGRGADLDAKDARGRTAVDAAMGRAGGNGFGGNRIDVHDDTASLLKELGAR
ncbi:MAG: ankyrin repeat domain-containing protein [Vicinamibacterales bacterium]